MKLSKSEIKDVAELIFDSAEEYIGDVFPEMVRETIDFSKHKDEDGDPYSEYDVSDEDLDLIFNHVYKMFGAMAKKYSRGGEISGDINIGMF
jgi:hypothetical protein